MVVLVTQLIARRRRDSSWYARDPSISDTPVDIDIRLLDFEMLQKVYVSE